MLLLKLHRASGTPTSCAKRGLGDCPCLTLPRPPCLRPIQALRGMHEDQRKFKLGEGSPGRGVLTLMACGGLGSRSEAGGQSSGAPLASALWWHRCSLPSDSMGLQSPPRLSRSMRVHFGRWELCSRESHRETPGLSRALNPLQV